MDIAYDLAKIGFNATDMGTVAGDQLQHTIIGKYSENYAQRDAAALDYAIASRAAYIFAKNPSAANNFVGRTLKGYRVDHSLSTQNYVVLRNDTKKHAMLAFRGTDAGRMDDLKADLTIAKEGDNYEGDPRFEAAVDAFDIAKANLGASFSLDVTGHSLGGSQAMWVSRNRDTHAEVFNPGVVGLTFGQTAGRTLRYWTKGRNLGSEFDRITVHRMDGDVVSAGMSSRTAPGETDMDEGLEMAAGIRFAQGHGAEWINSKFESKDGAEGAAWLLEAHSLDNYLTQSIMAAARKSLNTSETELDRNNGDFMMQASMDEAWSTSNNNASDNIPQQHRLLNALKLYHHSLGMYPDQSAYDDPPNFDPTDYEGIQDWEVDEIQKYISKINAVLKHKRSDPGGGGGLTSEDGVPKAFSGSRHQLAEGNNSSSMAHGAANKRDIDNHVTSMHDSVNAPPEDKHRPREHVWSALRTPHTHPRDPYKISTGNPRRKRDHDDGDAVSDTGNNKRPRTDAPTPPVQAPAPKSSTLATPAGPVASHAGGMSVGGSMSKTATGAISFGA